MKNQQTPRRFRSQDWFDNPDHIDMTALYLERFLPSGELAGVLPFPCANITKLAFGGADLQTVQVTTAWKGLSPAERSQQPLACGLFSFRADTPGLAQHYISTEVQK